MAQIDVLLLGDQGDYCYLSSPSSTFFPAVWFEFRMFCVATIHNGRGTNHLIAPAPASSKWVSKIPAAAAAADAVFSNTLCRLTRGQSVDDDVNKNFCCLLLIYHNGLK